MSPCIVLLILEIFFEGRWFINVLTLICIDIKYFYTDLVSESATQAEIDHHLELGKQYLAKGQLSDALSHYHEAVGMFLWYLNARTTFHANTFCTEGDPNNYLTYFKRGTVYLALGKAKNALSDLDKVLELKPDFTAARISRGNVHLKQGNYDLAQLDFYNVVSG